MDKDGNVDNSSVRNTLNRWLQLGLFEDDQGVITIRANILKEERNEASLPKTARKLVLSPENNKRFWEVEKSKAADFNRSVAWLLAQDVYKVECCTWDDAQPLIQKQIPDEDSMFGRNNTRWDGLKDWAPYLGFAWSSKFPKAGSLIIDPTVAVQDALPSIFEKNTLSPDEFLQSLANEVPVLDQGEYRKNGEEKLSLTEEKTH